LTEGLIDRESSDDAPLFVPAIDEISPTREDDQSSDRAIQTLPPQETDPGVETPGQIDSSGRPTPRDPTTERTGDPKDFPIPPAANDLEVFEWKDSEPQAEAYPKFGRLLASKKDFYRRSSHGGGLLLAPVHSNAPPVSLDDPARFQAAVLDYVRVNFVKDGKSKGGFIPTSHLRAMSRSELFLRELPAVDEIVDRAIYLPPDFRPTEPGYNNRGLGHRILHIGPPRRIARAPVALKRFFDVMEFESPADLANAYAACITVALRNFWPGGKPIVVVSADKSHAGKETLISCIAGLTSMIAVSYQKTNWAFERSVVVALQDPKVGVINIDNARLEGGGQIRSAFLERFLTDAQPFLFSTGTGPALRLWNNVVVTMSTNEGSLSPDLMNRTLPIKLVLNQASPQAF